MILEAAYAVCTAIETAPSSTSTLVLFLNLLVFWTAAATAVLKEKRKSHNVLLILESMESQNSDMISVMAEGR